MERHDTDLTNVLRDDGVTNVVIGEFENRSITTQADLLDRMGDGAWAARLVFNERFGGVLIRQMPGEGNRLHHHHDADECWVIIDGEWEWFIEGVGVRPAGPGDIILVEKGTLHKITCVGDRPGIRFAVTAPDVDHVYEED